MFKSKHKEINYVVATLYKAAFFAAMIGRLSSSLCNTLNSILVGQFMGTDELAAISLLSPVLNVSSAASSLIGMGAGFLGAFYIGDSDRRRINGVYTISLGLAAIAGLLFTLVFIVGAPKIVSILGAVEGDIHNYAVDYLRGVGIGMIPSFMYCALATMIPLDESSPLVLHTGLVLAVVGVASDLVMLVVLKTGIFSIGLSSCFAYIVALIMLSQHYFKPGNTLHIIRPDNLRSEVLRYIKAGLQHAAKWIIPAAASIVVNSILLSAGGSAALAANGVLGSVSSLVLTFAYGADGVMFTFLSRFRGEKDKKAMCKTLTSAIKTCSLFSVLSMVVVIIFAPLFCMLFGIGSGTSMSYGKFALYCFAISMLPRPVTILFATIQDVMERMHTSMLCSLLSDLILIVPLTYIMSHLWGVGGAFAASAVAQFLMAGIYLAFIAFKGKKGISPENWFMFSKSWDDDGKELSFFMDDDADHYMHAVRHIAAFCESNGLDSKTSNRLMLCAEEISELILENTRKKDEYENIDFRCMQDKDCVYLRLKFVGSPYNPLTDVKAMGTANMKLIQTITDSQDYSFGMGLNVVILRYHIPGAKSESDSGAQPAMA